MQYHEIRYANLAAAKIGKIKDMLLRAQRGKKPHPTLSKGEGFKLLFKVSPFGGDLEGASCFVVPPHNDMVYNV